MLTGIGKTRGVLRSRHVGGVLYHTCVMNWRTDRFQDDTVNDSDSRQTPEDSASSGKSRIDREIDEILSRSDNVLPMPPRESRRNRPSMERPVYASGSSLSNSNSATQWRAQLLGAPIVLGLIAAILAFLISGSSQLLANLFAFAAVVLVLLPIIQGVRSPASPPEARMWRGQAMDPGADESSPIAQLRRWWSSQRR